MTEPLERSRASQSRHGASPPRFGGIDDAAADARQRDPEETRFERIQASPEFTELRGRHRRFVFPVSSAFFAWYMLYVVLAAYAHGLMTHRLVGSINVAIIWGIVMFLTTAVVTTAYVRFAHHDLDPLVDEIRAESGESGEEGS